MYNIINKFECFNEMNNFITKIISRRNRKPEEFYNETDFKSKSVNRIEESNFIMIRGSFYQKDITNLHCNTPNKRELQNTWLKSRFKYYVLTDYATRALKKIGIN